MNSNFNADTPQAILAKAFARCFRGDDGAKVLQHLRFVTFERFFGPETSADFLHFVEGQKALVAHIEALIKAGKDFS